MAQTLEINSLSEKLQKIVDKARPKEGGTTFKLLSGPTPVDAEDAMKRRFTMNQMPAAKRLRRREAIIDPGTGRPVTIANLTGYHDGVVGQAQRPIIDEVVFRGHNGGEIFVPFNEPVLFERLLLSNYNKDNPNPSAKEPEYGFLYGIVRPERDAGAKLSTKLAVARALNAIDELGAAATLRAAGKLDLPTMDRGRTLTTDELKLKLVDVAESEPDRLNSVLEAGENKIEELVEKATRLGLIDFVESDQQWRWKATQQPITEAVHGFKPEEALVLYIQKNANGPQFSQMLVARIAQEEKK